MKAKYIYIFILLAFIKSYDYKILDLESYKHTYYVRDMVQNKEDIIIYEYEPITEIKNVFLIFLGHSKNESFEFYLYKDLSDIAIDDNKRFTNYTQKFNNYGEIHINQPLDVYYILVRMNEYKDMYEYFNFMIYNTEEYWNIGELKLNEEYVLAFEGDKDMILTYDERNFTQYLYINAKGDCEQISFKLYKNDTEGDLVKSIYDNCKDNQYHQLTFLRDSNFYLKLSFRSIKKNEIFRLVFYFLTNKKNIAEIKDYKTDFKYGYTSYLKKDYARIDRKYFFINTTDLPIEQLSGFSIIEPLNSLIYKFSYKRYEHFYIDELPQGDDITDYDYSYYNYVYMESKPFIFYRKYEDTKGLLLKIESYLSNEDEDINHNEMVVYLYPKYVYDLNENHKFNHTELSEKKVFYLENMKGNFLMKSNLDYFTTLHPSRKRIRSKTYVFKSTDTIFELQDSENASVEFRYIEDNITTNLSNPYIMFLCKKNIQEEKFIYLPYMTNFNILFGDIKVYDIDVSSLNSLDDFYVEKYMKNYYSYKRYENYFSMKDERFFYKLKCNNYSLIKFEDSFESYNDENITINQDTRKIILDFSRYEQKKINFQTNLSLYIGIMNSSELSENWTLNFYINDENYILNKTNNIFFQEFKTNDTLIIDKPDNNNIYPYINVMYNFSIEKFRPLRTNNSGIFVFDKNNTEEYNVFINITNFKDYYYSTQGKYSLFYGDPNNYEFNQLISYQIEISNNPYKYLENNDINNYFFILYNNGSNEYKNEIRFMKISGKGIIKLNELTMIKNFDNERAIVYLPKINESTHVFIQYFDKEMDIYSDGNKLTHFKKCYDSYQSVAKEYKFYDNIELYSTNNYTTSYKTFILVSYVDIDYYNRSADYCLTCDFEIDKITNVFNNITIDISNDCSTTFHYYIFIFDNTSTEYNEMSPLELFYAKKNNNNIKCYEFTTNKKHFEILDTFEKGRLNITIVGQSEEGFRRIVFYTEKNYYYSGWKPSYLTEIILGCVFGAVALAIIIYFIYKCIEKIKYNNYYYNNNKDRDLLNKVEEKNELKSADFDCINGPTKTDTPDTPTPM